MGPFLRLQVSKFHGIGIVIIFRGDQHPAATEGDGIVRSRRERTRAAAAVWRRGGPKSLPEVLSSSGDRACEGATWGIPTGGRRARCVHAVSVIRDTTSWYTIVEFVVVLYRPFHPLVSCVLLHGMRLDVPCCRCDSDEHICTRPSLQYLATYWMKRSVSSSGITVIFISDISCLQGGRMMGSGSTALPSLLPSVAG